MRAGDSGGDCAGVGRGGDRLISGDRPQKTMACPTGQERDATPKTGTLARTLGTGSSGRGGARNRVCRPRPECRSLGRWRNSKLGVVDGLSSSASRLAGRLPIGRRMPSQCHSFFVPQFRQAAPSAPAARRKALFSGGLSGRFPSHVFCRCPVVGKTSGIGMPSCPTTRTDTRFWWGLTAKKRGPWPRSGNGPQVVEVSASQ